MLDLHHWNVDFAVWCSYKYLNGGPGAIGGCFVHERHATRFDLPRFAGWWGHDKDTRFLMGPKFKPLAGAQGWQISNPPILSAAPLLASLEIFRRAGLQRLRAKSIELTAFLQRSIELHRAGRAEIITPPQPQARGCQLSIRLLASARRGQALLRAADRGRRDRRLAGADILRLAPTPLYNSFADALFAVEALARAARP